MWRSFFKALIWASVFLLIGMFQLGVTYLMNIARANSLFDMTGFFLDGFFLFLAISTCCGIVYEFFIDAEIHISNSWNTFGKYVNLCLILFLIGVILVSMVIYSVIYFSKGKKDFQSHDLIMWQEIILYLSFIFSLGLKWIIYYHDESNTVEA